MLKKYLESHVRLFFSNLIQVQASPVQQLIISSQISSAEFILQLYKNGNKTPLLFSSRREIQKYVVELLSPFNHKSISSTLLEFGVFKGTSLRYFSKNLRKFNCIGFDSFEGLQSNFGGVNANLLFRRRGKAPKYLPRNAKVINGKIENTLADYLLKDSSNIRFIHLDLDVYSSTKFVLNNLKERLNKDTLILFDEMFGNPFWENGEYLAMCEVFSDKEFEWIGFGPNQALIRLK